MLKFGFPRSINLKRERNIKNNLFRYIMRFPNERNTIHVDSMADPSKKTSRIKRGPSVGNKSSDSKAKRAVCKRKNKSTRYLGKINYYRYATLKSAFERHLTSETKRIFEQSYGRQMNSEETKTMRYFIETQCKRRGPKISKSALEFQYKIMDFIGYEMLKRSAELSRRDGLVLVGVNHLIIFLRNLHGNKKTLEHVNLLKDR